MRIHPLVVSALLLGPCLRAEPELVRAFALGSHDATCALASQPDTNYTILRQQNDDPLSVAYTPERGHGYEILYSTDFNDPNLDFAPHTPRGGWEVFGPIDRTANDRERFADSCPERLYDSFIGSRGFLAPCDEFTVGDRDIPCDEGGVPADGIVLRVDVPNGNYRFVAAVGDADFPHAHRIVAEDGGQGPPAGIGPNHVVLVHNFDQAQQTTGQVDALFPGKGVFARVGFDGRLPPAGDGVSPDPQFVNMDEQGRATPCPPNSPVLRVTTGVIRIHQLQGNSNFGPGANGNQDRDGGDLVLLEIWRVDEEQAPPGGGQFGPPPRVTRTVTPRTYQPGGEVTVRLEASEVHGPTTVEDIFPTGFAVSRGGPGEVRGNAIRFVIEGDGVLTYRLRAGEGACPGAPAFFEGSVVPEEGCGAAVTGDESLRCEPSCPEPPRPQRAELVAGFVFGARNLPCPILNQPDRFYTVVHQLDGEPLSIAYDDAGRRRGWGYEVFYRSADGLLFADLPPPIHTARAGWEIFGPFDNTPNERDNYTDGCSERLYDSFIGAKNFLQVCSETVNEPPDGTVPCAEGNAAPVEPDGIIFRVDVPNGKYRFVAAVGDADFPHAHRIVAENGGRGPPREIGPDHVVLVKNFDQAQQTNGETGTRSGAGVYGRVGFEGKLPPPGDEVFPGPQFVNMDETGSETTDCPRSPTLVVTEGFIRVHQLQGNSNNGAGGGRDASGGDLVVLEIWKVEDPPPPGTPFVRGDADADGSFNITDAIFILNFLFLGGPGPPCREAANSDGQGNINITDGIYVLGFLFSGGPAPPAPFPDCGVVDGLSLQECSAFASCP